MKNNNQWKDSGKFIGGRKAYYDEKKGYYYTLDGRHNDIEVWKVTGKKAYHQGSIECKNGKLYKEPNHNVEKFELILQLILKIISVAT